mgnify:CR=1 FL=1
MIVQSIVFRKLIVSVNHRMDFPKLQFENRLSYVAQVLISRKFSEKLSLEIAPSAVTERADVVLPVAAVTEKSGSFLNWTSSARAFDAAVADSLNRSDVRILSMIADALGKTISLGTVSAAAREIASLGPCDGARAPFTATPARGAAPRASRAGPRSP